MHIFLSRKYHNGSSFNICKWCSRGPHEVIVHLKRQLDEVEPQNFNLFSLFDIQLKDLYNNSWDFSNYDFPLSHQNEIDVSKPEICFDPSFMLKMAMALFLEGRKILVKYNT